MELRERSLSAAASAITKSALDSPVSLANVYLDLNGFAPLSAAAASQQQRLIVFFEFDKSALSADGKKVVMSCCFQGRQAGCCNAVYSDLASTQQYNLALSRRCADTVKTALVRDGVPAAAIDENWHGKENPRVPTADGVREPQNRRAEITM